MTSILIIHGILFIPFCALVFSMATFYLAERTSAFDISGPDDFSYVQFFLRYNVVAAAFTFVSIPCFILSMVAVDQWAIDGRMATAFVVIGFSAGIYAMSLAYQWMFSAEFLQAFIMTFTGGLFAVGIYYAAVLQFIL